MHAIGAAQLLTHYAAMIEPRNRRGEAETCRWYTTGRVSDGAPHYTHAQPDPQLSPRSVLYPLYRSLCGSSDGDEWVELHKGTWCLAQDALCVSPVSGVCSAHRCPPARPPVLKHVCVWPRCSPPAHRLLTPLQVLPV